MAFSASGMVVPFDISKVLTQPEAEAVKMNKFGLHVFDKSWKQHPTTFHSASFREITLRIYDSEETLKVPCQTCTKVGDVKMALATRCLVPEETITFMVKQGAYMKKLTDIDSIRNNIVVKGIKNFSPAPVKWKYPLAILGAGYNGIKNALLHQMKGHHDWILFDRLHRVGGTAWLVQANKTSKLQTDFAAFHVWFGPEWDENNKTLSFPTDWSSWPKKDEVIASLEHACERYALFENIHMKSDVIEIRQKGKVTDIDRYYDITIKNLKTNEDRDMSVQQIMHFPGAYFTPRQIIYPGEESFGGAMGFGMADDIPFDHLPGNRVAILGNGAFAVENIRTSMEYGCAKVYQVCRRKNLASPRMVCWFVHQAIIPVPAGMLLNCCQSMYDCCDFGDPWSFHSIYGSKDKGACTISSNSRFGIGDVTFLACATGRCEYVVDTVKRFSENTVHLNGGGTLDNVQVIIKALGLLADFNCDKLHDIKEMIGLFPQGDNRRAIYCDALGMHAANFSTKSTGTPSYTFSQMIKYFMDFPKEWNRTHDELKGILPRSRADENKPACQYTAQYSANCIGMLIGANPALQPVVSVDNYMHKVVTACYPLDKYYNECLQSWDQYQAEWKMGGFEHDYIPYPYTREEIDGWMKEYEEKVGPLTLEDADNWWSQRDTKKWERDLKEGLASAKTESEQWWLENSKSWRKPE